MISVTILTKNSAQYIQEVLKSLVRFPEVVVVDTGSEDDTIQIASRFDHVTLYQKPFIGFGPTHNMASALCKNNWILSIDSDEIASSALVDEILALHLNPNHAYCISRKNYYRGKYIKGCGWYPDRVVRLTIVKKHSFLKRLCMKK